jgi:hypothetical protein
MPQGWQESGNRQERSQALMSSGLSIPQDVMERAAAWAIQQALERVDVDSIKCISAKQAAEQLGISVDSFKRLARATDYLDLGEKLPRWSLKDIRQLIESRKVKAPRSA